MTGATVSAQRDELRLETAGTIAEVGLAIGVGHHATNAPGLRKLVVGSDGAIGVPGFESVQLT